MMFLGNRRGGWGRGEKYKLREGDALSSMGEQGSEDVN
jgi:hypothetical protein